MLPKTIHMLRSAQLSRFNVLAKYASARRFFARLSSGPFSTACNQNSLPTAKEMQNEYSEGANSIIIQGKTIGLNVFGSNLEIIARNIFKHFGLNPDKEIKFLAAGTMEARFSAMKQGLIAATLGGPPTDFLGEKMGFVVLARAHELFSFPVTGVVSSDKKIKEKPDEIKRVIKAGIKANRYIRQNRDGTIQVMMEWMKIDKEMATATYDSVGKAFNEDGSLPEDGLRLLIEEAKKATQLSREVASSEVADLSILRDAQRELGIKGR